jgi:hypothetical protein
MKPQGIRNRNKREQMMSTIEMKNHWATFPLAPNEIKWILSKNRKMMM